MYVGVCVSEGHSWGEQSPIRANFSLDYMNWLSVLAEARHAGHSTANPPSQSRHISHPGYCTPALGWSIARPPDLLAFLALPGPGSPLKLSC